MSSGWIKLHRKLLENDDLFRGGSTFPVWCYLLLTADRDGSVRIGRNEMSRILKIKPSTIYLALKRLENLTMIQQQPDKHLTRIYICNWDTYQQQPDKHLNKTQQQPDTIQERRIKNKEITKGISFKNEDLKNAFSDFEQMRNKIKKPMTERAKQLIVKRLETIYPNQPNMQIICLNQSVENCWQSIYPVKQERIITQSKTLSKKKEIDQTPEDREKARLAAAKVRTELAERMSLKTKVPPK